MGLEILASALIKKAGKLAFAALDYIVKDTPLSYNEVMDYFIEHQKDDDRIVKGAMVKQKMPDDKVALFQVFMDKDNNIIEKDGHALGRKITAIGLDTDILKVFRDKDIVIIS